MASRIPVSTSTIFGNAEQITHSQNGGLFNFNASVNLKEKLQMLIDNPHLIMEANKNNPQLEKFDDVVVETRTCGNRS